MDTMKAGKEQAWYCIIFIAPQASRLILLPFLVKYTLTDINILLKTSICI